MAFLCTKRGAQSPFSEKKWFLDLVFGLFGSPVGAEMTRFWPFLDPWPRPEKPPGENRPERSATVRPSSPAAAGKTARRKPRPGNPPEETRPPKTGRPKIVQKLKNAFTVCLWSILVCILCRRWRFARKIFLKTSKNRPKNDQKPYFLKI